MTDLTSLIPDVKKWKWSQLAKAAAVAAFGWLMLVAYKATDEIAALAKYDATLAGEVAKLKADAKLLAAKEALATLSARVEALEAKASTPPVTTGSIKKAPK